MPTHSKRQKLKYFFQARLHEDTEDEADLIPTILQLSHQGWDDRAILRAALRALKQTLDEGYTPQQTITPVLVDSQMMQLLDLVQTVMKEMAELSHNLNNGIWTQAEAAQHATDAINKIGITMESATHAGKIIDIDVEDW